MAKHEPQLRDRRKPGWFYLDDAVIDQYGPAIGPYGIAVYTGLARHANAHGETSVGYNRLASTLSMSRNKVISTLRTLADEGLISIEPQTDIAGNPIAANIYTLCVIPDQKRAKNGRGVPQDGRGVPQDAPPHAPQGTGVPQDGRGVPPGACEGIFNIESHDPTPTPTARESKNVGVGVDPSFVRALTDRGMGSSKALEIAQSGHDSTTVLQSLDNMLADGKAANRDHDLTIGNFINRLKLTPPEPGKPYQRTRATAKGAPLTATKPNIPERTVAPAEMLRQVRARNEPSNESS